MKKAIIWCAITIIMAAVFYIGKCNHKKGKHQLNWYHKYTSAINLHWC